MPLKNIYNFFAIYGVPLQILQEMGRFNLRLFITVFIQFSNLMNNYKYCLGNYFKRRDVKIAFIAKHTFLAKSAWVMHFRKKLLKLVKGT